MDRKHSSRISFGDKRDIYRKISASLAKQGISKVNIRDLKTKHGYRDRDVKIRPPKA